MQNSSARLPGGSQNIDKKPSGEPKILTVSEADQLSPVALKTNAANRLKLSPLQWSHYNNMPASVYAKNTGFTVMIQASFSGIEPYLCSGPLTEKYIFSQIHFHWGEHDETGSGHSVDGVRFPLEMHVVHVKKGCANFNEASGTKDGIAIAVHLFTLKEERNSSLDQLTAVLQFIQRPGCCARLYPSSLAEVVHPFSNDYFLYWGAVPGSGQQRYRIVWLVSREVLPVSSQQLHQFRELIDGKGNFIWSNSNRPHPLGDRSLFLVSPSEKTYEPMFGVARQPISSVMGSGSGQSTELHNSEFKSLAVSQEIEVGSCALCPHPNHKTTTPTHSPRITEGDNSVEETSINLGTLKEPELEERREYDIDDSKRQTNDKKTACGNSCTAKYIPSQNMYSVIAANEEALHLKRKPLVVRKSDPSTEQACVFLTSPLSVHSAQSAPSLTTWGPLGLRQEYTDLHDSCKNKESACELCIKVYNESSDFSGPPENNEEANNFKISKVSNDKPRNLKDAATQRSGNVVFDGKEFFNITVSQDKHPNPVGSTPSPQGKTTDYKSKESNFPKNKLLDDDFKTEYLLVKQTEPKKSFYKVIGEFLLTPDSKRTFIKKGNDKNGSHLSEIKDKVKCQPTKQETSAVEDIVYKQILVNFPSSEEKSEVIENNIMLPKINTYNSTDKSAKLLIQTNLNSLAKGSQEMFTTGAKQKNVGEKTEEASRKYYVTKITPVDKSQHESSVVYTEKKIYYAKPVHLKNDITAEKISLLNNKDTNSATPQQKHNHEKIHSESKYLENIIKEQKQNISHAKNSPDQNNFIDVKTVPPLENTDPSDHLLSRKKVQEVGPDKFTESDKSKSSEKNETPLSSENETFVTNYTDYEPSLHETPNTTSKDLKNRLNPGISVKIVQTEKSQTIYQIKKNIGNQNKDCDVEASNEQKGLSDVNENKTNNSNKKKIKLAISFRSNGENSKPNEIRILKNLTLDENEDTGNKEILTKPLFVTPEMQAPSTGTNIRKIMNSNENDSQISNNDEIVIKQERLENTVYSKRIKKTGKTKDSSPVYKIPNQTPPVLKNQSSSHLVTIKKVEVPDPYYLTREPRPPLVEVEALQTGPSQRGGTFQTEEFTSKVQTKIKTFTLIKKGNKKGESEKPVSAEKEPINSGNAKDSNKTKTKAADLFVSSSVASNKNQQSTNIASSENTNLNGSKYENTHTLKKENSQNASFEVDHRGNPLQNKCFRSQPDDGSNEVKKPRIVIGSHQPNKTLSRKENQTLIYNTNDQTNQLQKPSEYQIKPVSVRDQYTSTESVASEQINDSKTKYVDAATSHQSGFLPLTSEYSDNQQSHGSSYTDIDEEPTRDTGTDTHAEAESTVGSRDQSLADVTSPEYDNTEDENVLQSPHENTINKRSIPKADKEAIDAIVYIHRGDLPSSADSVRAKEPEVKTETQPKKLLKNSKNPSDFQKARSEMNQPLEELISSQDYGSDDKGSDSSRCDITFKNETKMELPDGQKALMRSMAEVKFKPSKKSKSGNPNLPTPEVKPSAKVLMDQTTQATSTLDKCCSAIALKEGKTEDFSNGRSVDTSTSVEDESNGNEITNVNYSPVRITTDETVYAEYPPLEFIDHWNRPTSEDALLENNGKTVRATFLYETSLPRLRKGPLEGDYIFAELHFHWGRKDCCGAEHIIDEKRHSMEAHFLYFKEDYKTVKEALNHKDGLAMVAIQLNVSGPPHPLFGQLIKDISLIKEAETGVYVPAESLFSWIKQTVQEAKGYFSYKGTMTSQPPFVEAVTWIVFEQPITFCCQQSLEFRKLMSQTGELLLKTFRSPRPVNNRTIFYIPL